MKRTWRNRLFTLWDVGWIYLNMIFSTIASRFSLSFQGCLVGEEFRTTGTCVFKARKSGSIRIGKGVKFLAYWRSNRVGLNGRVELHTIGDGEIEFGDFSGGSSIVLSSKSQIIIGERVKLGGNVRIYDHDFHSLNASLRASDKDSLHCLSAPVTLGNDVFVGANTVILKGVTLGDRVIVGAGSVVTKSFEADSVIVGNPARKVR